MFTPSRFKRALGKIDSRFNNSDPQDAHELLMLLMEEFKLGVQRKTNPGAVENLTSGSFTSLLQCGNCSHTRQGWRVSTESLVVCLRAFFDKEMIPLSERWWCANCKFVAAVTKQLVMDKYPSVLVLHMKRFHMVDGLIKKKNTKIDVPCVLEIGGFKYNLVGVVKHQGSRHSGHYVAEVRVDDGWFHCNDGVVKRILCSDARNCSSSYLLFFVK